MACYTRAVPDDLALGGPARKGVLHRLVGRLGLEEGLKENGMCFLHRRKDEGQTRNCKETIPLASPFKKGSAVKQRHEASSIPYS